MPADDLSTSARKAKVRLQRGDLNKVALILVLLAITALFWMRRQRPQNGSGAKSGSTQARRAATENNNGLDQ